MDDEIAPKFESRHVGDARIADFENISPTEHNPVRAENEFDFGGSSTPHGGNLDVAVDAPSADNTVAVPVSLNAGKQPVEMILPGTSVDLVSPSDAVLRPSVKDNVLSAKVIGEIPASLGQSIPLCDPGHLRDRRRHTVVNVLEECHMLDKGTPAVGKNAQEFCFVRSAMRSKVVRSLSDEPQNRHELLPLSRNSVPSRDTAVIMDNTALESHAAMTGDTNSVLEAEDLKVRSVDDTAVGVIAEIDHGIPIPAGRVANASKAALILGTAEKSEGEGLQALDAASKVTQCERNCSESERTRPDANEMDVAGRTGSPSLTEGVEAAAQAPLDLRSPPSDGSPTQHNVVNTRAKRSAVWLQFIDAGPWQAETPGAQPSKFRKAICKAEALRIGPEAATTVRSNPDTMRNHLIRCPDVHADLKRLFEDEQCRRRREKKYADSITPNSGGDVAGPLESVVGLSAAPKCILRNDMPAVARFNTRTGEVGTHTGVISSSPTSVAARRGVKGLYRPPTLETNGVTVDSRRSNRMDSDERTVYNVTTQSNDIFSARCESMPGFARVKVSADFAGSAALPSSANNDSNIWASASVSLVSPEEVADDSSLESVVASLVNFVCRGLSGPFRQEIARILKRGSERYCLTGCALLASDPSPECLARLLLRYRTFPKDDEPADVEDGIFWSTVTFIRRSRGQR